jgi:transposase-like protein
MGALMEAPEVEVSAKAQRRRFTAKYKLEILREADACSKPGELTALLRREGLYSSNLLSWRRQREAGELSGLTPKKRGPKARPADERDRRIAQLERELAQQTARAEKAEAIVEIQKKLGELLGVKMPDPSSTGKR